MSFVVSCSWMRGAIQIVVIIIVVVVVVVKISDRFPNSYLCDVALSSLVYMKT